MADDLGGSQRFEIDVDGVLRSRLEAASARLGVSIEELLVAAASDRADEILGTETRVDAELLTQLRDDGETPGEEDPRLLDLAERARRFRSGS